MRLTLLLAAVMILSGCMGGTPSTSPNDADPDGPAKALTFSSPVQVNAGAQEGFEPSMRIAPDGTIYVAAARGFLAGGDAGLASPVWYSQDQGSTWTPLPSDASVRQRVKAIEGDLAVDARGSVYFVDTYMLDNVITVWDADQTWRSTRPVQGTSAADDRPWLAAHGDGVLYYVANSAVALPAPDRPSQPTEASRIWFYRSTDAGSTWTLGHAFTGADYCHVAASPADDRTVVVVCTPAVGVRIGTVEDVMAYVSHDRGDTWTQTRLGPVFAASGTNFPSAAFSPDGTAFAFWVDDGMPATLHLRAWDGSAWSEVAAPEVDLRAANPWVAAGPDGSVGLAFYGHDGTAWHLHAWKGTGQGEWAHWTDPEPVSTAACPPEDFFQTVIDEVTMLHIVYQQDPDRGECAGVKPAHQPLLYVRQLP